MSRIVLASRSATRIALLKAAGIAFDATPSNVDERATESSMAAGRLPPIAVVLSPCPPNAVQAHRPSPMRPISGILCTA